MNTLLNWIGRFQLRTVFLMVFVLAIALTFSSFFIQYVLHEQPCPMCLWQRYSHMTIWGICLVTFVCWPIVRMPKFILAIVYAVGVYSAGVGLYQGLGQQGWVELPETCTGGSQELATADNLLLTLQNITPPPNCADIGFTIFGLTLAWWNFVIMSCMLICLTIWFIKNSGVRYKRI